MNLSELKKKAPTTAWFDFSEGVRVQLSYVSPEEVRRRVQVCTKMVNGREEFDQDRALAELAKNVLAWEGLTFRKTGELMDIEVPDNVADREVPCADDNKIALLKESWEFKPFVERTTIRLGDFVAAQRELERKNSSSSPSGSLAAA